MDGPSHGFRAATAADISALTDLEQAANETSIAHLFPGIVFPRDAVAQNWWFRLTEPATNIEVLDAEQGLACFVCFDTYRIHHLAVHPDHWGRGLARAAVEHAVVRMADDPVLWCLRDNVQARGFYEHLGWTLTDRTAHSDYPPYLPEVEYTLRRGVSAAGGDPV